MRSHAAAHGSYGLFILHKCCPKYCSCKHIMNAVGPDFDPKSDPIPSFMLPPDGGAFLASLHLHLPQKFRLCKYLFKIPHAYHSKSKRTLSPRGPSTASTPPDASYCQSICGDHQSLSDRWNLDCDRLQLLGKYAKCHGNSGWIIIITVRYIIIYYYLKWNGLKFNRSILYKIVLQSITKT